VGGYFDMGVRVKTFDRVFSRGSKRGEPTWELRQLDSDQEYPRQGEWTEEAYLALNAPFLVELVDGCLEFPPMATMLHQLIVRYLHGKLDAFVTGHALGIALFAPLSMYLWPERFRQPDILFLRAGHKPHRKPYPRGADLVMEIVSGDPKDRTRDLVTKRREYARVGISEYWIVDPKLSTITVLMLKGKTYRQHGVLGAGTQATSVLLRGFSVSVDEVFAAGRASV